MKFLTLLVLASCVLLSCKKEKEEIIFKSVETLTRLAPEFTLYTIQKGKQYCDNSTLTLVNYKSLHFKVKFDSSAIYATSNPWNQFDINKLYGFSDNNAAHQEYSARFGWRWNAGELEIFSYVYNDGKRSFYKITSLTIGEEYDCSIQVAAGEYTFTVNDKSLKIPRQSTTPEGEGYKLFPYFGGDEVAPHRINIYIKDIPA